MIRPNIETFIGCESSFEQAAVVLYGAPFDSTTSFRPGARFGPSAIRHESFGLETYSPYQDRDLMDIRVFDSGDLELCFGSSEMALSDIEKRAEEILKAEKIPVLLGGEHLVTLAAVRAVFHKYPDLHPLMPAISSSLVDIKRRNSTASSASSLSLLTEKPYQGSR